MLAFIRLAFFAATLVASLNLAAAPRFWTLTGAQFNESGTFAAGYFSYDDAAQTISDWNVHVNDPFAVSFPAFTYVPGNSVASAVQAAGAAAPTLSFSATIGVPGPYFGVRQLQITPVAALDGSNANVSIMTVVSREDFGEQDHGRWIIAGSLALTPAPPPVVIVQVDEFYHSVLRHYFITASAAEKQALDTGVYPGWVRTGESFKAYAAGSRASGTINPVCRYYSDPQNPDWGGVDSHFFSADASECLTIFRKYASGFWEFESDNVFQINLPDKTTGACPVGTVPVYRLWNQRVDSNHRYTTSAATRAEMLAAGYVAEGYGADGVVMCAVQ